MQRIQHHRYGGPETMSLDNFELDMPAKGQVAVQVSHAAINPIDWKLRDGAMKMMTGNRLPRAMGMDFSGTVLSVGSGVNRFKPGDAVFGMARLKQGGAFGEAVVTNESFLTHKPEELSFEDAACLATPGVTAWIGLVDKARLQAGQRVFINGCAGGVGAAAVQLARQLGAEVSGTCSATDMERMHTAGARQLWDYRKTDLAALRDRFDVVYDTAATMPTALGLSLLKPRGVLLDLNPDPVKFLRALVSRRYKVVICSANPANLGQVAAAAARGQLRLPVGKTASLREGIALISDIEAGRKIGGRGLIAMA